MNARDAILRDGEKATLKISHMSAQEVMHLYACWSSKEESKYLAIILDYLVDVHVKSNVRFLVLNIALLSKVSGLYDLVYSHGYLYSI